MNDLTIFKFEEKEVRTVEVNGEIWFVLKDVCNVLNLSNPTIVASRLEEDEVSKFDLGRSNITGGGEINIINESGLYNVILRSDKPEAKKFKRWVTHEVLPSIRKTGGYIPASDGDTEADIMAKALVIAHKTLEEKEKRLKAAENKALQLEEENDTLEIALNQSLKFYTVAKYNKTYKKGWDLETCKAIGKFMTAFCKANSYEIRRCETNDERFGKVNSYPLTAWEQFYAIRTV